MRSARLLVVFLIVGLVGCRGQDSEGPGGGASFAGTPVLSYVTDDFFAAVVLHPARIARSSLVKPLLEMEPLKAQMAQAGMELADLERFTLLVPAPDETRGEPDMEKAVFIVRLAESLEVKAWLTKVRGAMAATGDQGDLIETTIEGKTCYKLAPNHPMVACPVGGQTMILASEETASRVLSAAAEQGPLAERLEQVSLDKDAVVVVALDSVRGMLREAMEEGKEELPPPLVGLAELPDKLAAVTVSADLSGDTLLEAVVEATDAESATKVEELLNGALQTVKMMFEVAKQGVPEEQRAEAGVAINLADQALTGLSIRCEGPLVTVTLKRPDGFAESVTAMAAQAMGVRNRASQRLHQGNNMRQIAVAMHTYHDVHKGFPAAATCDADGKPLLSWRVELLPYLEAPGLYEKFKRDEPWDSPHNIRFVKQMPEVFLSVGRENDGKTSIMVFTGEGTAFAGPKGPRIFEITDGMSNTIMCVEAGPDKAVPWTKPEDLPFDPEDPMAALGEMREYGFHAARMDGSSFIIEPSIDPENLRGMITPAGGEVIEF